MKPIKENKYQKALFALDHELEKDMEKPYMYDYLNTLQELIDNHEKLEQDYKELKGAFNDCLKDTNKEDRYEIALFMVIRNSQVLPNLIDKAPLEDIDDVSYKTMLKCLDDNYLDWSKCEMIFNGAKDRHNKGLN